MLGNGHFPQFGLPAFTQLPRPASELLGLVIRFGIGPLGQGFCAPVRLRGRLPGLVFDVLRATSKADVIVR
jgi:hypothetical protein